MGALKNAPNWGFNLLCIQDLFNQIIHRVLSFTLNSIILFEFVAMDSLTCIFLLISLCRVQFLKMNNMFDMSFMGSGNAQSSSASPSSVGMTSTFDQFGANPPVVGMGSTFDQFGFVGGLEGIGGTGASMFAPLTIPSHTTASTDSLQSSTIMSSVNALPCSANKVDYSKHYVEYSSPTGAVTDSGDASQSGEGQVNVDSNEQSNAVCDASAETSSPVEAPIIDIIINNVVCSFSTRCHLNLKKIAREGMHVIYKPENGVSLNAWM